MTSKAKQASTAQSHTKEHKPLSFLRDSLTASQSSSGSASQEAGTVPLLTPAQFTRELATLVEKTVPEIRTEIVGDLKVKVEVAGTYKGTADLKHAYEECALRPDEKDIILAGYVGSFVDACHVREDEPIDKSLILPVLKHVAWIEAEPRNTHQPFSEDLVIAYGMDKPRLILYLRNQHLATLNMGREELHELAVRNLETLFPTPEIWLRNGVIQVTCHSDYDASLVLHEKFWSNHPFPARREIVVAVPARDCLLVAESDNSEGLRKLSAMAHLVNARAPYHLSPRLLVRREGRFVTYQRP